MNTSAVSSIPKAPWHLWVIGVISLLWNAMGAFDFSMTITQNELYMSSFTEEQLEFFYGFPIWINIAWGLAVIGSVVGSALLLFKQRVAYPVFVVSFVSMLITTIHNFFIADGMKIMGGVGPLIFSAVIFVVALLLVFYSSAMGKRGILG